MCRYVCRHDEAGWRGERHDATRAHWDASRRPSLRTLRSARIGEALRPVLRPDRTRTPTPRAARRAIRGRFGIPVASAPTPAEETLGFTSMDKSMRDVAYYHVDTPPLKPLVGIGSSLKDLKAFPRRVRREIGRALRYAQLGGKHPDAKPLRGFGGAGVLEVIEDDNGSTYRRLTRCGSPDAFTSCTRFRRRRRKGSRRPSTSLS